MSFRNHRNKIKAYRAAGKMFGQTCSTAEANARVEERERLGIAFNALRLPGHWPALTTTELQAAIAKTEGD